MLFMPGLKMISDKMMKKYGSSPNVRKCNVSCRLFNIKKSKPQTWIS